MARRGVRLPLLVVLIVLALLSGMSLSARAEPDAADGVGTPVVTVDVGNPLEQERETEPAVTPNVPASQPTDEQPTDEVPTDEEGQSDPGAADGRTDDQQPQTEPTVPSTVDYGPTTTEEAPGSAAGQTQTPSADNVTATDTGRVRAAAGSPSEPGFVFVEITDCEDPARVGQTDFFVFESDFFGATADSSECEFFLSNESDHQYTLIGVSVEYSETSAPSDFGPSVVFFDFLQPGTYQLRSDATGAVSPVFTVRAGSATAVSVYEYFLFIADPTPFPTIDIPPVTVIVDPNETPVIVDPPGVPTVITEPGEGGFVFGIVSVCRDASRPGDTEFRFVSFDFDEEASVLPDGGDTNVPGSIGALCRRPAAGEVTIVLTNVVTGEQRRVATQAGGFFDFFPLPAGLYTLTEAASGDTSTVFAIREFGGIDVQIYLLRAGGPTATTVPPDGTKVAVTVPPVPTKDVTEEPAATVPATVIPAATRAATQVATEVTGVRVTTLPSTGQRSERGVEIGPLPLLLAVSSLALIGAAVLRRRRTA